MIDLSSVRDIESVQTLVLLLSQRAGSTVSYANLARDLDFLINLDGTPTHLIEVKMSNGKPARGFQHFGKLFPKSVHLQVVKNLLRDTSLPNGLLIKQIIPWLAELSLLK